MPDAAHATEPYRRLGLPYWDTVNGDSVRERVFPYSVNADYNGRPLEIRFGAFLGWAESMDWWVSLARSLSLPSLTHFGLIDIEHQAGGHSCLPWFCVALPVRLNETSATFMADLCRHYFHAHGGYMSPRNVNVDEDYRDRLELFGVTADCLRERGDLMEAVYPVDGTDENLVLLLAEPQQACASLQPLLCSGEARKALRIYVLAENSD